MENNEIKGITPKMREELRKPFPPQAYKEHDNKSYLTVLKAMYVTERLNDVFGVGRWTVDTIIIERTSVYVLMSGSFKAFDYPDVSLPKQYGGHKTAGVGTEIADGFKSAVTDCISKLASYLEIGIDLFKGEIKVPKTSSYQPTEQNNKPLFKTGEKNGKEWHLIKYKGIDLFCDGNTFDILKARSEKGEDIYESLKELKK